MKKNRLFILYIFIFSLPASSCRTTEKVPGQITPDTTKLSTASTIKFLMGKERVENKLPQTPNGILQSDFTDSDNSRYQTPSNPEKDNIEARPETITNTSAINDKNLLSPTSEITNRSFFDSSTISLTGRYFSRPDHSITLTSPAAILYFLAKGSAIQFTASAEYAESYIDVLVDGQLIKKGYGLSKSISTITISLGDKPDTLHLVQIYNRGEGDASASRFYQLDVQDAIAKKEKPNRRIMFIGASVTCGALAEPSANCRFNLASHNGRVTHGTLIADALNAEGQLICRSGRGILNGEELPTPQNAEHFIDYTINTPTGPIYWDHSSFIPDAILIALGNNDNLGNKQQFKDYYKALLDKLGRLYPRAHILLTEGPLISGERKEILTDNLKIITQEAADAKIQYITSKHYPESPCSDHPDVATHAEIAEELLPLIKKSLGW